MFWDQMARQFSPIGADRQSLAIQDDYATFIARRIQIDICIRAGRSDTETFRLVADQREPIISFEHWTDNAGQGQISYRRLSFIFGFYNTARALPSGGAARH